MEKREKLFYFRRFFCGRKDVYAFRVYGKGYRPRRTPEFELTDNMVIRHMCGEVMLGAYPLLPDGGCDWVAADFDGHNGNAFEHAYQLAEMFREYGVDPLCNTSQSGKGVHVRVIFADPIIEGERVRGERIKAWQARSFMNAFIEMCGLPTISQGGAFDRIFPTQDELPVDGHSIGNQIAMPLHLEAAEKRQGSMLLDQQFKPIPLGEATWDAIELYDPLERVDFVDIAGETGKSAEILRPHPEQEEEDSPRRRRKIRTNAGDMLDMVKNCDFFKHAYGSRLSYDEWIALAANLAAFDDQGGRDIFHSISKIDDRYDEVAAEQKYQNIYRSLRPTRCVRIADSWRCSYLGGDGQCNKFRSRSGRGPKSPAAVPWFLDSMPVS